MAEKKEKQYYTLEEIARHNGNETDRVWIIYKDGVYDCTDYLDDHPGGGELITEWAGMDSTRKFDRAGHSGDAMRELKKYKIGEVVEEQRKKAKKSGKSLGPTIVENTEKKQTSYEDARVFKSQSQRVSDLYLILVERMLPNIDKEHMYIL